MTTKQFPGYVTAEYRDAVAGYVTISTHRTREGAELAASRMRKRGRSPVHVMLAADSRLVPEYRPFWER